MHFCLYIQLHNLSCLCSVFILVLCIASFPGLGTRLAHGLYCFVFVHAQLAVIRDIGIVHLNERCFNCCLCYLEFGVIKYIRIGIVHSKTLLMSYSSHDQKEEQCLLLCSVLNFGVSKLPSPSIVNSFLNMLFAFVHSWLSRE